MGAGAAQPRAPQAGAHVYGMCMCVHVWAQVLPNHVPLKLARMCMVCACVCMYGRRCCPTTCPSSWRACVWYVHVCACMGAGAAQPRAPQAGAHVYGMCMCVHVWAQVLPNHVLLKLARMYMVCACVCMYGRRCC